MLTSLFLILSQLTKKSSWNTFQTRLSSYATKTVKFVTKEVAAAHILHGFIGKALHLVKYASSQFQNRLWTEKQYSYLDLQV